MFPIQNQISAAAKVNFEANLALVTALTSKTLESMEKLCNLNIAAARASMEESQIATRQLLAVKDPQEFFSLVAAQGKPNFDKAVAYSNHLTNIAGSVQAEFGKAAESQFAQFTRKLSELVDEGMQKTPAGSGNMFGLMKATMGNFTTAYEQFTKTAKQAAEVVEATVSGTATQLVQAPTAPNTNS